MKALVRTNPNETAPAQRAAGCGPYDAAHRDLDEGRATAAKIVLRP